MVKRLILCNFLFFILISFFSCSVSADSDYAKEKISDDSSSSTPDSLPDYDTIFTFQSLSDSTLAITGTLLSAQELDEITIPSKMGDKSITLIKKNAFRGLANLQKVSFLSDEKVQEFMIEPFAFSSCPSLEIVTFSENHTISSIPQDAKLSLSDIFSSCPSLNKIVFSGFKEEELKIVASSYPIGVEIVCSDSFKNKYYLLNYTKHIDNTITITGFEPKGATWAVYDITIPNMLDYAIVRNIGQGAFSNHNNIRSIKLPETIVDIKETAFDNCPALKKIICHNSVKELGYQFPEGVEVEYYFTKKPEINAICFEAEKTFTLSCNSPKWDGELYYGEECEGQSWAKWNGEEIASFLSDDGKYRIYMRGNNTRISKSSNMTEYTQFCINGEDVSCYGNIMALLKWDDVENAEMADYAFAYLFANTPIISAPSLPATVLSKECYRSMFSGCKYLHSAPELPALNLASGCYRDMFSYCSAIEHAPLLPATKMEDSCYHSMFKGCGSLYDLPELSATVMAPSCYAHMFKDCHYSYQTMQEKLQSQGLPFEHLPLDLKAPDLPATTLAEKCYESMFRDSYFKILPEVLPAKVLAKACYKYMFGGSYANVPPSILATELAENSLEGMFIYCSKLEKIPLLRATELKNECYKDMFNGAGVRVSSAESSVYKYKYPLPECGSSSGAFDGMFAPYSSSYSDEGAFFGTPASGQILWTRNEIVE